MEQNCHTYGGVGPKIMAKATPKARGSMTGEDVKNKTQDNY